MVCIGFCYIWVQFQSLFNFWTTGRRISELLLGICRYLRIGHYTFRKNGMSMIAACALQTLNNKPYCFVAGLQSPAVVSIEDKAASSTTFALKPCQIQNPDLFIVTFLRYMVENV